MLAVTVAPLEVIISVVGSKVMTLMMKEGAILKTDVLGRLKTPKARREGILDDFEAGGLSGLKFAELVGMKYPTFASWI